jgi:TldD protein
MVIIDGRDVQSLAMRAIDAAKAAGAHYAEARLTRFLDEGITFPDSDNTCRFGSHDKFGMTVRVRVGGAWGFAGSPYWEPEEVVILAREAVAQARGNARVTLIHPEWAPIPVARGHWATPIKVDPFVLSIDDKVDWARGMLELAARYRTTKGQSKFDIGLMFQREERATATSEGSYFTQTLYLSQANFSFPRVGYANNNGVRQFVEDVEMAVGFGNKVRAGWEHFTEADLPGQLPALYEAADPRKHIPPPVKMGEVGRYEVVFDAGSMGKLLEKTWGMATQLDRVLGYEANAGVNAGGTSYLGPDPLVPLGTQVAAPLVTMMADRSMPKGLATVKWDDEGVEPSDFTLIKDGVLVDYQTTRELAPFLAPWYQKQGRPVRSNGCAWSEIGEVISIPMQHVPNLTLEPGKEDVNFDDLVRDTKKGFAVLDADVQTDFQSRNGEGIAKTVSEIKNGKLGAEIRGLEFLFKGPDLWKNVLALGGARSAIQYASAHRKGQPWQVGDFSVRAVPGKIKDVAFIDPTRKA